MNPTNEHATVLGNAVINTLTAQGFYLTQEQPESPKLTDLDQLLFYYSLIKWDMAFNSHLSHRLKNYAYISVYNWLTDKRARDDENRYVAPDADMNGVSEFFHRHTKSSLKVPLHEHEQLRDVKVGSMVRVYRGRLSFGGMSVRLLRIVPVRVRDVLFGSSPDDCVIAEAVEPCPECRKSMLLTFLPECGHPLWVHETQEDDHCSVRGRWNNVRERLARSTDGDGVEAAYGWRRFSSHVDGDFDPLS
jgi:hypothetical protein